MTASVLLNFSGELHRPIAASLETGSCWNRITRTSSNTPTYTWVLLPRLGLQSFFHASKSPRFQHSEPPPLPLAPLYLPTYLPMTHGAGHLAQSVSPVQSTQSAVGSSPPRFSSVQFSSVRLSSAQLGAGVSGAIVFLHLVYLPFAQCLSPLGNSRGSGLGTCNYDIQRLDSTLNSTSVQTATATETGLDWTARTD